ncbi:fumarylacetoacetate hydrolase family protein [Arthrobacter sp. B1805]|uniref:fumarylacetoacetate hydrolase family protein n=1 Tax=Arthrobacter sp. B1805 TaxID=2058892 RepID=UPI0021589419|nr:fumarylacetoacetate hydrolase family protein [Arthrobacter sp. B1805]
MESMKLLSFSRPDGRIGAGLLTGEGVRVLEQNPLNAEETGWSPMRRLLHSRGSNLLSLNTSIDDLELLHLDDLQILAPVPDPSKIMAAPVNYRDHQVEMDAHAQVGALGLFLKAPSSILAPNGTVKLPYLDRRFDQEAELAIVIGRVASHLPIQEAASVIAGYTLLLDMTMRGDEDRSTRKSFDTFTPMGPFIVTTDEIDDLGRLSLKCSVDGRIRQHVNLADLIWGVPELVSYASSITKLMPGDIISTGTPAGVGPVMDSQTIEVEIAEIGKLEVNVSSVGSTACPTTGVGRWEISERPSTENIVL